MQAIILAAGKGNRIKELTKGKPKCLLPLGKETVIERQIRLLNEMGFSKNDIFLVTGYQSEMLEEIEAQHIFNEHFDTKDNSYSLLKGLYAITEDAIIMDSDLCFDKDALEILLRDTRENVVLSRHSNDLSESTGICVADGKVAAIGKQYKNTGYVYLSIFKIGKRCFEAFKEALASERSAKTWYTLAITEICKDYNFYNRVFDGRWHEIDDAEDYRETLKMFDLGETR